MSGGVITSRRNPLVQELRVLTRTSTRKTGRCVLEGWRLLGAAVSAGIRVTVVLYTPEAARDPDSERLRSTLRSSGAQEVVASQEVFDSLTQVESPQGVLAIVVRPAAPSESVIRDTRGLFAVLDSIQDPGNVGAILRTAAAVGVTAAVTAGAAADPYSPKALRASAGSVFRLPLLHFPSASAGAAAMTGAGIRLLVADPRGDVLDSQVSFARPLALVFGSERAGANAAWAGAGAVRVRLPMAPTVESLNVAAAAAVLLYRAGASQA